MIEVLPKQIRETSIIFLANDTTISVFHPKSLSLLSGQIFRAYNWDLMKKFNLHLKRQCQMSVRGRAASPSFF